jgi:dihydrofolate reductase / thymidylate synthase
MKNYSIIVAIEKNNGIGKDNKIPWSLSEDLKYFKKITSQTVDPLKKNAVIMGRKTWESIPEKYKPLSNRINVVISNTLTHQDDTVICNTIQNAIDYTEINSDIESIFVIGGNSIYVAFLKKSICNKIYLTKIHTSFDCDTFFPNCLSEYAPTKTSDIKEENNIKYEFREYIPFHSQEHQYLDLIKRILDTGDRRNTRNDETLSVFGVNMEFDISLYFPLLTTKKVFFRGIFEELLWILSGSTNTKDLAKKGVNIWNPNSSKEFLKSRNLDYNEGDIGPTYGFLLRHFGAEYTNCDTDYSGKGYDQVEALIHNLKHDKCNRRLMLNLWNPSVLDKVALPVCAFNYMFYVDSGKLNVMLTQRSADVICATHWNYTCAALLVYLLCNVIDINLTPGKVVYNICDAHIYTKHISQAKEVIKRNPRVSPKLIIKKKVKNITDFEYTDIELIGYNPMKSIKVTMIA